MRKFTSVKMKKMSIADQSDAETLNEMFKQMTGISDAEPDVIIPKYLKVRSKVSKYYKLFNVMLNFEEFKTLPVDYSNWVEQIRVFMQSLINSTGIDPELKYPEIDAEQTETLQALSSKDLNIKYRELKKNEFVRKIIKTSSNLGVFKIHLETRDELNDAFIKREPGYTLTPLDFSGLDLKVLWDQEELSSHGKTFLLQILHHAYILGKDIYNIVSSPDVDITKFSSVLVGNISKLRKQIPRCDKAFDAIENSIKLLETKFGDYYKTSVEAENPTIIMESFIIDVATNNKASPSTAAQFRKIIMFLKNKSTGVSDPKVKKLFSMLNSQFNNIDKQFSVKTDDSVSESSSEKKESH